MLDMKAQEKVISMQESLNRIICLQRNLHHNADNAKQNIQLEIGNLRAKLNLVEEEMMIEVDKEASRKAFLLQQQEQVLKLVIRKLTTASSFVNKTISFASDVEVALIRKMIHERMKELEGIHIETKPQCNDEISQKDLKPKIESLLRE